MTRQSILMVDDRPENLIALEYILEGCCADLIKATDGHQALAATLERDFALSILDVQMPGMDGYELAELLRGNPETRQIPIILLTAASAEEWQVFRGYESGAVDYIVKPVNPTVLLSKVNVFLEMHAQKTELKKNRDRLAALNEELKSFSYAVSHDLKAPLRAMEGFSQALLEDCLSQLDDEAQDYLRRIASEAHRMSRLIEDLLMLSRVTSAELSIQAVDLTSIAKQVMEILRTEALHRRAELSIEEQLIARGDPSLLRQMMENLLSNAWKYTGKRHCAKIQVGATEDRGTRVFYVRDNGVGFDMKYADKVFKPFQRLHGPEDFPGTGIGMSTVKRIVHRHGGRIWLNSIPEKGTTVFFCLGEVDEHA